MKRVLWVVVLVAGIIAGFLVIRGLSRLAQQNPKEEHRAAEIPAGAPLRTVRLYFGASDRVALVPEERAVLDPGGPEKLAETIATEVFRGPGRGTGITGFSPSTRVRAFYLAPDGTGYLDLSADFLENWPQGDGLEWVSLGSLVRSITDNVPGVRCVYILVAGNAIDKSPGSIPLDLPLEPEGFGAPPPGEAEGETEMETEL
jgi:hypothetical protein